MPDEAARKPRLTDRILDDLQEAISSVEGDIAYLSEALERTDFPIGPALRAKFGARCTALSRAHDWLVRYCDAERVKRSAADTHAQNDTAATAGISLF